MELQWDLWNFEKKGVSVVFNIKNVVVKKKVSKRMGYSDLYLYLKGGAFVFLLDKLTHDCLKNFTLQIELLASKVSVKLVKVVNFKPLISLVLFTIIDNHDRIFKKRVASLKGILQLQNLYFGLQSSKIIHHSRRIFVYLD